MQAFGNTVNVYNYGSAQNTVMNGSQNNMIIKSGGYASGISTANQDCSIYTYSGGYAESIILGSSGYMIIANGASAAHIQNSGRVAVAGLLSNAHIESGGILSI